MRFSLALIVTLAFCVASAQAEFVVWISDKAPGENPVPGVLNLQNVGASATGTLYVYGDGDTRVGGVSMDISTTGNGIKFVGPATVNNPASRWSFTDGPLTVTDNLVDNFGGVAIPPGATGIGGSIADEIAGVGFLLGQFGYMGLGNAPGSLSNLVITVSDNLFADYDTGGDVTVRLGGPQVPSCIGSTTTCSGAAGSITIGGIVDVNTPPVIGDLGPLVGDMSLNGPGVATIVSGTPSAADNQLPGAPLAWSILSSDPTNPAVPLVAPTINPTTGLFSWDVNGSKGGTYKFTVQGTDNGLPGTGPLLSDTGLVTVNVIVPEPATLSLLGLALVGFVGFARRRS